MLGSSAGALNEAFGYEEPSLLSQYFFEYYLWLIFILVSLSVLFLLFGVIRIFAKTRLNGRRLMISGVVVVAATFVHEFLAFPKMPSTLMQTLVPNFVLALGVFLIALGFARVAWAITASRKEGSDA